MGKFMRLGSFEASFSFGLLVIADPASMDDHGDWDPSSEMVHASADSIYVSVRDTASGLVSLTCMDEYEVTDSEDEGTLIFSGNLVLQSRRIRFSDPNEMISMTIPVENVGTQVKIYADDVEEPAALVVAISAMERR
jgi:hypothetical protein